MKKEKKILIGIAILFFSIGIMYVIPFINPITVKGIISDYNYTVYGDYVEIEEYTGMDKEVEIPTYLWGRKVKIIGAKAFYENRYIEHVLCSKYIEKITGKAFADCNYLETVKMGKATKFIGYGAFDECINLKRVELNDGLEEISVSAFGYTKSLTHIYIPETVRVIGEDAFLKSGLKKVTFGGCVSKIGGRAFHKTEWLESQEGFVIYEDSILIGYQGEEKEICIPSGVKELSGSFAGKEDIETIYIPDTVTYISNRTFYNCKNVTVYIPDSVKEIQSSLIIFDSENITIVTTAGSYAESFAKENGMKCEIVEKIEYPTE